MQIKDIVKKGKKYGINTSGKDKKILIVIKSIKIPPFGRNDAKV